MKTLMIFVLAATSVPSLFACGTYDDPSPCPTGDYLPQSESPYGDNGSAKAGHDSEMRGAEAAIEEEKRQVRERREERREQREERRERREQQSCNDTAAGRIFGCPQ